MKRQTQQDIWYQAFAARQPGWDGLFWVGVTSTGIFCHPSCPARKPKRENCEFFTSPQDALLAGYRPCKRCGPTAPPREQSDIIRTLAAAVEEDPARRWREQDVRKLGIDPSTAARHFKRRFGISFIAWARARRMGLALKQIKGGETVINTQIDTGYDSGSGFRDAFTQIMGSAPSKSDAEPLLAEWFDSPLGPMVVFADDQALHLLEFTDRRGLEREVERLRKRTKRPILPGRTAITDQIEAELAAYFAGEALDFQTPLALHGSDFQQSVWRALQTIPAGETRSYKQQAITIGKPEAVRAVARANGANQLAIIIPCHRVIGADGSLTGYGGGLARKEWLIAHEQAFA